MRPGSCGRAAVALQSSEQAGARRLAQCGWQSFRRGTQGIWWGLLWRRSRRAGGHSRGSSCPRLGQPWEQGAPVAAGLLQWPGRRGSVRLPQTWTVSLAEGCQHGEGVPKLIQSAVRCWQSEESCSLLQALSKTGKQSMLQLVCMMSREADAQRRQPVGVETSPAGDNPVFSWLPLQEPATIAPSNHRATIIWHCCRQH